MENLWRKGEGGGGTQKEEPGRKGSQSGVAFFTITRWTCSSNSFTPSISTHFAFVASEDWWRWHTITPFADSEWRSKWVFVLLEMNLAIIWDQTRCASSFSIQIFTEGYHYILRLHGLGSISCYSKNWINIFSIDYLFNISTSFETFNFLILYLNI